VTSDGAVGGPLEAAEHELRRVQHLDGEPAADLHLRVVDRGVGAGAP